MAGQIILLTPRDLTLLRYMRDVQAAGGEISQRDMATMRKDTSPQTVRPRLQMLRRCGLVHFSPADTDPKEGVPDLDRKGAWLITPSGVMCLQSFAHGEFGEQRT